ncbi:hypothetical protein AD945_03170 [Gluconobacter albidus]|uniref:Uncharacterized protein n=1 Tax=Gluconobacter albidus TaxID=318683 RepID=A0A149TLZ6_9PROT|nr:hypothetical protein [Gluconobacter albidus]KXV49952.1 hypothetical protein AD945_03170 [Gluconobacter albidus]
MSSPDHTSHRDTGQESLAPNLALARHNLLERLCARNGHSAGVESDFVAALADLLLSLPSSEREALISEITERVQDGEALMARVIPTRPELVQWTDSQKRRELSARVFSDDRLALLRGLLDEQPERLAA